MTNFPEGAHPMHLNHKPAEKTQVGFCDGIGSLNGKRKLDLPGSLLAKSPNGMERSKAKELFDLYGSSLGNTLS